VAGNIVVAWLLTLPAAAAMGAATYGFCRIFGDGAAGPVIICALALAALSVLLVRRLRQEPLPA